MNIKHNLDELLAQSNNILLLQGPIGGFFHHLAKWLMSKDKRVFKINFNAGDDYYYPKSDNVFSYSGNLLEFNTYLFSFCKQHNIDNIICFGDSRAYHLIAKKLCTKLSLGFWVFEEGYFRPHYVTFEKDGVNNNSKLPRNAAYFLNKYPQLRSETPPKPLAKGFRVMACVAMRYYFAAYLGRYRYPHYKHHRSAGIIYYIKHWAISGIKKAVCFFTEKPLKRKIIRGELTNFFILPLQVHNDSQVLVHSRYQDIHQFIKEVLDSFYKYAPKESKIIIKHHPMDRGFTSYKRTINQYKRLYPELKERIFYVYDIPIPVLLRKGRGLVTINSTTGLSALLHHLPVITLGKANYNFPKMTFQGKLKNFWHTNEKPDEKVFNAYRLYHINKTLINGSFYYDVELEHHDLSLTDNSKP